MAAQFYIEQISHNNVNGFEVYTTLRPDCLESTILKITGKISVVIYSLLFQKIACAIWNITCKKSTIFQIVGTISQNNKL